MYLKQSYFLDYWMVSYVVPVFKNVGERSKGLLQKSTTLLFFFLWLVKSLKNVQIIDLLIAQRNKAFSLISSMILGLFDQLQIFCQLYLIEVQGFLTGLGLLDLQHLIYPRVLTGFDILVFFTNLSVMEFQVRYLDLFLLFSIIDGFSWFWMGILHKDIQLMVEISRVHFWSHTFLTIH